MLILGLNQEKTTTVLLVFSFVCLPDSVSMTINEDAGGKRVIRLQTNRQRDI